MKILVKTILTLMIIVGCDMQFENDKNRQLVDKYMAYWNTGEFEGIEDVLHSEFELRMTPDYDAEIGIQSFKDGITKWRTAYPDFTIEENESFYSDNKCAIRWTITATNTGQGNMPPTGKKVNVMGMSIFHFQDNKIKDEWIASNNLVWLQQIGFSLVPPSTE